MPTNKRTRDSRYTKNFGDKPRVGRRYVLNGKVRIEWYEEGKRRSRTIGDNTAEVRQHADEALEEILEVLEPAATPIVAGAYPPDTLEQGLRACAVSVLDLADLLAESAASLGSGIVERLRRPPTPTEVEEGEVPPELPEAEVLDDGTDATPED